jgi:hypothetical protein
VHRFFLLELEAHGWAMILLTHPLQSLRKQIILNTTSLLRPNIKKSLSPRFSNFNQNQSIYAMIAIGNHMILRVQSNALIIIIFMAPFKTLILDYFGWQMHCKVAFGMKVRKKRVNCYRNNYFKSKTKFKGYKNWC